MPAQEEAAAASRTLQKRKLNAEAARKLDANVEEARRPPCLQETPQGSQAYWEACRSKIQDLVEAIDRAQVGGAALSRHWPNHMCPVSCCGGYRGLVRALQGYIRGDSISSAAVITVRTVVPTSMRLCFAVSKLLLGILMQASQTLMEKFTPAVCGK